MSTSDGAAFIWFVVIATCIYAHLQRVKRLEKRIKDLEEGVKRWNALHTMTSESIHRLDHLIDVGEKRYGIRNNSGREG